jgi:hypothetical protein
VVVDGGTLTVKSARVYDELDKDTTSELSRVWSTQRRRMGVKPGLGIRPGVSVMTPGEPGYIEPPSPHVQIASSAHVKMISPRCVRLVCRFAVCPSLDAAVCSNAHRGSSCGWIRASTQAQYAAVLTGYASSCVLDDLSQAEFMLDQPDTTSLGHTTGRSASPSHGPPPSPRDEFVEDCSDRTATCNEPVVSDTAMSFGRTGEDTAAVETGAEGSSQSQLPSSQAPRELGRASVSVGGLESSSRPMKMKKPKRRSKSLT